MNILRPLSKEELNNFFSKHSLKVIQYFMNTSLFAQPEVYKNKASLPIQIPKEHLEQWFVQSLKVEAVGAGSYPIDILKANEWGADVKMLSCKVDKNDNLTSGDSGETSLAQKFVGTGISLDDMFNQEQYQKIIDGWTSIWKDKLVNVKTDKNIENVYFVRLQQASVFLMTLFLIFLPVFPIVLTVPRVVLPACESYVVN